MNQDKHLGVALIGALAIAFIGIGFAQKALGQGPGSAVVQVTSVTFNPEAPPVGTRYTVTANVTSRHNRPLVIRGIIRVPNGDKVERSPGDVQIAANGSATLTWTVYCGVNGGQVFVGAEIIREIR